MPKTVNVSEQPAIFENSQILKISIDSGSGDITAVVSQIIVEATLHKQVYYECHGDVQEFASDKKVTGVHIEGRQINSYRRY